MIGLIGKKLGMSNIFDAAGNKIPVTIIQAGPCKVTNIRSTDKDGYNALQLGYKEKKEKKVKKPQLVYFQKNNLPNLAILKEFRTSNVNDFKIGDEINLSLFNEGDIINVRGVSKGKGFQGVMRRHNFGGVGGTTHGQSDRLRAPGSVGASSYPSRVFKGQRMAGRMGNDNVTVRNLKVIKIILDKNLILIKGAVPGSINSIVELHKK